MFLSNKYRVIKTVLRSSSDQIRFWDGGAHPISDAILLISAASACCTQCHATQCLVYLSVYNLSWPHPYTQPQQSVKVHHCAHLLYVSCYQLLFLDPLLLLLFVAVGIHHPNPILLLLIIISIPTNCVAAVTNVIPQYSSLHPLPNPIHP